MVWINLGVDICEDAELNEYIYCMFPFNGRSPPFNGLSIFKIL
jgi:hypothetical protein